MRLALLSLITLLSLPAQADIYKYVDEEGNVTYTNVPRQGAKKLRMDDSSPAKSDKAQKKRSGSTASPGYFPRVDVSTQRRRDDMRRQLLTEELRSEQRNLGSAQAALAAGRRQPGSDINKLMEAVQLHQKNIEMLNKELSLIR